MDDEENGGAHEPTMRFGRRRIGSGHPVCIIAEIGINHEGDEDRCRDLIAAAAEAGADAVKLQSIDPDREYAPDTESYAIFSKAIFDRETIANLFAFAAEHGLEVFSTSGDVEMLRFVDSLSPAAHKISSGLADHTSLIKAAAETRTPLLISTGMCDVTDVDRAITAAREGGAVDIGLLQCVSLYPTTTDQANLRTLSTLSRRYDVPVGFSDHTLGTDVAGWAVAAGATIIEKHLTLDSARKGFDHQISLEPDSFARLVRNVRQVEAALGSAQKEILQEEKEAAHRMRRCVVAARDLAPRVRIGPDDVGVMRVRGKPLRHIPPHGLEEVIGRETVRPLKRFEPIEAVDLVPPLEHT